MGGRRRGGAASTASIAELDAIDAWPTWVLSNHDNPRHRTRYGGDERIARAAAVLLLTLRGTPFLYAGEELGLEDAVVPPRPRRRPRRPRRLPGADPVDGGSPATGGRAPTRGCRGRRTAETRNVAAQRADDASVLHLYRRLLAARRASPALHSGSFAWLDTPDGVLAYERSDGQDTRRVAINFSAAPVAVDIGNGWSAHVTSDGRPFDGAIGAYQAVLFALTPGMPAEVR